MICPWFFDFLTTPLSLHSSSRDHRCRWQLGHFTQAQRPKTAELAVGVSQMVESAIGFDYNSWVVHRTPPPTTPPKKGPTLCCKWLLASIQAVSAQLLESKMDRYRWSGIQVKFNCDALGRHKLKALSVSVTLESWLATRVWSMNDMAVTGTHRTTHYPLDEIHWDKTWSAFNFQPWWRKHVESCAGAMIVIPKLRILSWNHHTNTPFPFRWIIKVIGFSECPMTERQWHRFAAGGLGEIFAVSFTHPADVLKAHGVGCRGPDCFRYHGDWLEP